MTLQNYLSLATAVAAIATIDLLLLITVDHQSQEL